MLFHAVPVGIRSNVCLQYLARHRRITEKGPSKGHTASPVKRKHQPRDQVVELSDDEDDNDLPAATGLSDDWETAFDAYITRTDVLPGKSNVLQWWGVSCLIEPSSLVLTTG